MFAFSCLCVCLACSWLTWFCCLADLLLRVLWVEFDDFIVILCLVCSVVLLATVGFAYLFAEIVLMLVCCVLLFGFCVVWCCLVWCEFVFCYLLWVV